nr:MAG TPA: hypothetical protein [Bacteriophage sp.]
MKYIITLLVALLMSVASYADVVRNGDTFKVEKTTSVTQDTQTKYTWEDKDGNKYPIFITKRGACYVKRVSKKTGKEYKQYLPKDIQAQIKQEMGIG